MQTAFQIILLLIVAFVIGRVVGALLFKAETAKPEPVKSEPSAFETPAYAPLAEAERTVVVPALAPEPTAEAQLEVISEPMVVLPVVEAKKPLVKKATPTPVVRAVAKPAPALARTAARAATKGAPVSPLISMTPDEVEAAVEAAGAPAEPARLSKADGKPDPLLDIIGIGPVNEVQLHALGIYHFRQIAAWTPENIKWVSERVKFPGRIVRENWMKQAAEFEAEKKR